MEIIKDHKLSKFAKFFIAYGEYHNNKINKFIHLICIPILTATLLGLMQYINYRFLFSGTIFEINCASLFFTISSCLYLYGDLFVGSLTVFWEKKAKYILSNLKFFVKNNLMRQMRKIIFLRFTNF
jgi:uncharacterized membrane protein YGL010W